jgi:acyl-CoA thioester hydrolase
MSAPRAQQLRSNSTDAERFLWSKLRNRNLVDAKFRRQFPIGDYVADFCCHEARLIVEVDGGQHAERKAHDDRRTWWLGQAGYRVIRFWNNEVLENLAGVLETIVAELRIANNPLTQPSPSLSAKADFVGGGEGFRPSASNGTHTPSDAGVLKPSAGNSAPSPLEGEGRGEGAYQDKTRRRGRASLSPKPPHLYRLRVYFEDTDAGGMVYYANYLKFAERARTEMLREAGFSHAELVAREGLMLVVRRCAADFRRSAHLDDELEVATRITELSGATIGLEQTIRRAGGDEPESGALVQLQVSIACVTDKGRPTRLPARLRSLVAIT